MKSRVGGVVSFAVVGMCAAALILLSGDRPASAGDGDEGPDIQVLSTGKAPKKELRYQLRKGSSQTLVTDMTMSMKLSTPSMPIDMKMPTIRMVFDLEVTDRIGKDEARYRFEVTDVDAIKRPGVQAMVMNAMKSSLGSIKGMSGTAIVDRRGFNRDAKMKLPAGVAPQVRQMMQSSMQSVEQMSTPLPAQALGVGARWRVEQSIEQNGMKIEQATVFRLVKRKGNELVLKADLEQTAPPQSVGGAMGGAKLTKFQSKGGGTVRIDLDTLVPRSDMKIVSDYEMSAAGQAITGHMEMQVDVHPR